MKVAALLIYVMTVWLLSLVTPSQTVKYAYSTVKDPVCTTGLLSGAELLSRGKTRTKLEHRVQSLNKEKDMLIQRVCKAASTTDTPTGTLSKISTVDDLVASIVSIVENDIEGTSAGTGRYALLSKQRLGSG
ncbi:uncharacterized protein LOC118408756, partial [Branchiostoma floridae]|uniref:Uncharacterized protein LOC118408756 n=1 Tax=Branchiostoma floridae TaxID=7739 RepID=A0A9J7HX72_BRAFL